MTKSPATKRFALLVVAAASVSLAPVASQAHCADNPPTLVSSVRPADGAETPGVDTGAVHCGSERQVPRTILPGANTLRARWPGAEPTSGVLEFDRQLHPLTFTLVQPSAGSAYYESQAIGLEEGASVAHGPAVVTVCVGEACKSASFATAGS